MARHRGRRSRRAQVARVVGTSSILALLFGVCCGAFALDGGADRAGDLPHGPSRAATAEVAPVATSVRPSAAPASSPAAAAAPVSIAIAAIGVRASIMRLSTEADGSLQVPPDVTRVGWYEGGPAPGALGAAVLAGHLDDWRGAGVFAHLSSLKPGDQVVVGRADGTSATFTVTRLEQVPKTSFPSLQVYGPAPQPELRMITCGGEFSQQTKHYVDNVLVFASLSG